jgi:hypothetical protein
VRSVVSAGDGHRKLLTMAFAALLFVPSGCSGANQSTPLPNASVEALPYSIHSSLKGGAVVIVSDSGTNEVQRYAYPSGKLIGTLGGSFSEPQGECSDGKGHFWITNTGDENIEEYSTNGTLLGSLNDSKNYPVGCAYDPKSGDLAVINIVTTGDGPGSVAIYSKATGFPKLYALGGLQRVYFAAYAGSTGTLVADGETASSAVGFATLQGGKSKSLQLTGATIQFPGGMGWSAKLNLMTVADQDGAAIYRFEPGGKVVGKTALSNTGDIVSYGIFGKTLLTFADQTDEGLGVFAFPSGKLEKFISFGTKFLEPIGIAISTEVSE